MRLKNIPGCREAIAASAYVLDEALLPECPGTWADRFAALRAESGGAEGSQASSPGAPRPLCVEVGTGKGQFLHELARRNPDINYLGIEKYSAVLLRAVQKMEAEPKPNLIFLRMEAENIGSVFAPGEVDRIYLNFSDPWPKDRHAKRRLPSREFLARYDRILAPDGTIEFKTDNRALFDFAVAELGPAGWTADVLTCDLHADEALMEGNVMTEYEEKFSALGNPICKYVIRRKHP